MCRMASLVLTKSRVYFHPDTDSHSDIIQLHHLEAKDQPHNVDLVKIEVVPDNLDYRKPLSEWEIRVDQDIVPDWFCLEADTPRIRRSLERWAETHVIAEGEHTLTGNITRVVLGGAVNIQNQTGGTVRFCGNSTSHSIQNQTGGNVWFCDNSTSQSIQNQTGGNVGFCGNSTSQSIRNQAGGYVGFYNNSKRPN